MKRVEFLGTSREDLHAFPANARSRIGHELFLVQAGAEPIDFKPMPTVGAGVYEPRVRDDIGAFGVIYAAKFRSAVCVLHAFRPARVPEENADDCAFDGSSALGTSLRFKAIGIQRIGIQIALQP